MISIIVVDVHYQIDQMQNQIDYKKRININKSLGGDQSSNFLKMQGKNHQIWLVWCMSTKKQFSLSIRLYRHYLNPQTQCYIIIKQKQMDFESSFDLNAPTPLFSEVIFDDMESQNNFPQQQYDTSSGLSNGRWDSQMSLNYHIVSAGSTNDVNEFLICNNKDMEQAPLTQVKKEEQIKNNQEAMMQRKSEMDGLERTRKNNPKVESNTQGIDQDQISKKQAKKNCLQFLACQLGKFFEKHQQILSNQERAALQRLKQTPTHLEFNNLFTFQKQGCLVQGIAEFFQPHRLSQTILASKVRNYTYKLVYKKEGNLLRKKFITSHNSSEKTGLSLDLPSERH